MNNKIIGSILLSVAGLVAAVATVGAQLAHSFVLAAFHLSTKDLYASPIRNNVSPHWLVFVLVVILAASGLSFLFGKSKTACLDQDHVA